MLELWSSIEGKKYMSMMRLIFKSKLGSGNCLHDLFSPYMLQLLQQDVLLHIEDKSFKQATVQKNVNERWIENLGVTTF